MESGGRKACVIGRETNKTEREREREEEEEEERIVGQKRRTDWRRFAMARRRSRHVFCTPGRGLGEYDRKQLIGTVLHSRWNCLVFN